jgi:hypothetical protein
MDKQSGSSSNSGQVNPPLTDKQCAYCARTGDLNLKCFCEIMSLPPMFYCSVACLLDHRHDAKRQHICGSGRAKPPAGASSSSKSGQKAVDLPSLIDIDDTTARGPCAFCRKEGKKICGPCGGENSRPTFYCSIACQFTDFPVHTHACGLEYPRNVDPMNGIF